jgi:hypothetical protein
MQYIEDGHTMQYIEDGGHYNTIYWRWSDNKIKYIEDSHTIQYNIL